MVMAAGGYRYTDYTRAGLPVSLLVLIVTVSVCTPVWLEDGWPASVPGRMGRWSMVDVWRSEVDGDGRWLRAWTCTLGEVPQRPPSRRPSSVVCRPSSVVRHPSKKRWNSPARLHPFEDRPTSAHAISSASYPHGRGSSFRTSHLRTLEAEAIYVMREVAAQFERPVLLFSGGKDSIVMVHLARKAFRPAPIPFPLVHVDTGHNFPRPSPSATSSWRSSAPSSSSRPCRTSIDAGPRGRGNRARGEPQQAPDRHAARRHRGAPVRRRLRRRPPRRGEGPRQGALLLPPRRLRPVGPQEPAPRALEPLQRPQERRASTSASSRSPT